MPTDERFMRMALCLAARARGATLPNPMVGALVVRSGRVVGRARHVKAGQPHAEAIALARAGAAAKGSTLYVTLEPCSHTGRTPPCVDGILKAGVRRVVAAMVDPDPRVRGRGLRRLRARGVRTTVGVLEEEVRSLNAPFITRVSRRRPFVTVKLAASLDGRIAAAGGHSRWISGPPARRFAHRLRAENEAVLVGVKTVLADDPRLTARGGPVRRRLIRVVLDSALRTPPGARLFRSAGPIWIAAGPRASLSKEARLRGAGAEVLRFPGGNGRVRFSAVLKELARRGVSRLLIEGGGEVVASALEARAVDRAVWIIAPKIFGAGGTVPAVAGKGARSPDRSVRLEGVRARRMGEDWVMEGRVRFP